ncbi:MAG: DUF58 domain-containing protein [Planctomycetales bacterium]
MSTSDVKTQFTKLFDNQVLSRLEQLRLNPHRRLTNRSRGEHLAAKGGTSTEFADYRNYVEGDDVRYVDWNIFARLRRPFLKLYQHEEEMHVVLIVDASSSMEFEDKFLRAKQLAAAFAVLGVMNLERVSLYAFHQKEKAPALLPPCTGRISLRRIFEFLENLESGGDSPLEQAVDAVLNRHRGRGIAILLSDFLTFGDLNRPFNRLFSAGLETFGVQILGPSELRPELTGDVRFVDSENSLTLDVSSAGDLLAIYHEHLFGMQEDLSQSCRKRGGRFVCVESNLPIESILFDQLCRKGWIR